MLKRTLACALFAITGHAYSADILVTTLVDEDKNDSVCSLREAIFFLNNRTEDQYKNGYNGCGDESSSSTIILKRDQEYKLNSHLEIKVPMTIATAASTDFNDQKKGLNNATISITGKNRLFVIDDGNVENDLIIVNLKELNLKGSAERIPNNGGLILNREDLRVEYSRFINGDANKGGAIYNAGLLSSQKTAGRVRIFSSIFQHNKADQGAVIYSEMPRYLISHSVIRDNEGLSNPEGALLFVQTGLSDQTIGTALQNRDAGITNSTIFHNKGGHVANIREGMILNNLTVIKNAAGLYLQSLNRKVTTTITEDGETKEEVKEYPSSYISNSIIVENGNKNCTTTTNDTTVVQSNLTTVECDHNPTDRLPNFMIGNNKLIAGKDDLGICDAPPADGLLCPYNTPKDQMLGFFKPRLLASYNRLSDSLIVNKGRIYSDGTNFSLANCERTDQRGISRTGYTELCDMGAIELVVDRSNIPIAGQDIFFNDIAKFNISESLVDGELLDPATCEKVLGKRSDGQAWQFGCLEVIQNQTPSKGTLTLDQDGNVTYVPYSNWHGADIFKMRIVTTTTRFNDISNNYIEIPTTIVQDPKNNFKSKTVNVGGGSIGFGAIIMLFGLIGLRRFKS
ncbi:rhombotarget A [Acinetobacter haemolyticus]|uniref:Rhombotarget A n=1 Tax=Acinetobacter haemolyticus TaxID=29430 RepID=A0A4P7B3X4_ACIHA|nr:rhombotarget A [Acinetobacter haemolyticus]MCU4387436.1 rhombotarget A [Acinetobacter haemolyticus]NCU23513.1 rhombotarget A [Acinetobacter haemolyticus]QBQ15633.1 rhombotarget A [Acinetobacter haemolyticus]